MSTDLVSWLRQAMTDLEREANRDEPGCLCRDLGCHHTEARDTILRTVAAHRAILDEHRPEADIGWDPGPDWCGTCRYDGGLDRFVYPCPTLRLIAAIYESRPGFDPSWRADP